MPYGPNAKTGLKQKSAALCTWLIDIAQDKIDVGRGYVRADLLEEIVRNVLRLKAIPQAQADDTGASDQ